MAESRACPCEQPTRLSRFPLSSRFAHLTSTFPKLPLLRKTLNSFDSPDYFCIKIAYPQELFRPNFYSIFSFVLIGARPLCPTRNNRALQLDFPHRPSTLQVVSLQHKQAVIMAPGEVIDDVDSMSLCDSNDLGAKLIFLVGFDAPDDDELAAQKRINEGMFWKLMHIVCLC